MFGSATLEVIIGLIFIFLLISIICSAIREGIEAWLKTRAAYLEHGIREMLQDKDGTGLAKVFYEHPAIYSLYSHIYNPRNGFDKLPMLAKGNNLPSYIPSKNFAVALMDIAARGPRTDEVSSHPDAPSVSIETIRMNIMNLQSPFVQRVLLSAIDASRGDIDKLQQNIEAWYNSAMDRVAGWYKRSTQWVLFIVGLVVAVGLNINIISITDYLYKNDAARSALVARAEAVAKDSAFLKNTANYNSARAALDSIHLPIGWENGWGALSQGNKPESNGWWNNLWAPILGWLITALAACMGAPFWFDLLNKVMVIRATVKPHEKSPEEASEDRQLKPQPSTIVERTTVSQQPSSTGSDVPIITPPIKAINIRDEESDIDGCDVEVNDITSDEHLPPAEGGVA